MSNNAAELLDELLGMPSEVEWLELKSNNQDPKAIGEYISALANTAILHDRDEAYLIFGIEDETKKILGTTFRPHETKVGNQAFMMWLTQKLKPHVNFTFDKVLKDGFEVIIMTVSCPSSAISFDGIRYIRVGSSKTTLDQHPEKEKSLWEKLSHKNFEYLVAQSRVSSDNISELLDLKAFAALTGQRAPSRAVIIEQMVKSKFLLDRGTGFFDITNLGALLLARDLSDFGLSLKRKASRVIQYKGRNKLVALSDQEGQLGYASGFNLLIKYINDKLPHNELIGAAFREQKRMYPEVAIRELVANALIHQDLTMQGTGPVIEIYDDRVEITNPGKALVETDRFIDTPARSRNEAFAYNMRQFGICEERGSGVKRALLEIELYQLPAPSFEVVEHHTVATLFAYKPLAAMSRVDKIRACYQHACLRWVDNEELTNASLREL